MSFPRVRIEAPGFLSECRSVASLLQNSTRGKRTHELETCVKSHIADQLQRRMLSVVQNRNHILIHHVK